jgi:hypothetical protein
MPGRPRHHPARDRWPIRVAYAGIQWGDVLPASRKATVRVAYLRSRVVIALTTGGEQFASDVRPVLGPLA